MVFFGPRARNLEHPKQKERKKEEKIRRIGTSKLHCRLLLLAMAGVDSKYVLSDLVRHD